MMIIRYTRGTVREITRAQIELVTNSQEIIHIAFDDCVQGWKNYVRTSGDFGDVDFERLQASKCVGLRHRIPRDMYVMFTANPTIRIEFTRSLWVMNPDAAFTRLIAQIHQLGWTTYDMS